MKTMLPLALSLLFASAAYAGSTPATTTNSCSIPAGDVECIDAAPQYDEGCSITCAPSQTANCVDATVIQLPDPNGRMSGCQLVPSTCECQ